MLASYVASYIDVKTKVTKSMGDLLLTYPRISWLIRYATLHPINSLCIILSNSQQLRLVHLSTQILINRLCVTQDITISRDSQSR